MAGYPVSGKILSGSKIIGRAGLYDLVANPDPGSASWIKGSNTGLKLSFIQNYP